MDPVTAEKLAGWVGLRKSYNLSLNGLTHLDAKTAEKLAEFGGNHLFLNGLKQLDASTAEKLATWGGTWLHLDGLTQLDAETAEKLKGGRGG